MSRNYSLPVVAWTLLAMGAVACDASISHRTCGGAVAAALAPPTIIFANPTRPAGGTFT